MDKNNKKYGFNNENKQRGNLQKPYEKKRVDSRKAVEGSVALIPKSI